MLDVLFDVLDVLFDVLDVLAGSLCTSPLHALSRLNIISPCGVEFFGTLEIAYHFPKCIIVRRLTLAQRHD